MRLLGGLHTFTTIQKSIGNMADIPWLTPKDWRGLESKDIEAVLPETTLHLKAGLDSSAATTMMPAGSLY